MADTRLGADPFRRGCGGRVATGRIIVPICDTQPKDPKVVIDALPISRFPVPDLAHMPEDIRNRILDVQEKISQTSFSCLPTGQTSSGPFLPITTR